MKVHHQNVAKLTASALPQDFETMRGGLGPYMGSQQYNPQEENAVYFKVEAKCNQSGAL